MCKEVHIHRSVLVDVLTTRTALIVVTVLTGGAVVSAVAGGANVLAWVLLGLGAYSVIITITLVAVLNSPKRRVVAAAPSPARRPPTKRPAVTRVVSRRALPASDPNAHRADRVALGLPDRDRKASQ